MLKISIFIFVITQLSSNCPIVYCQDNDGSFLEKDVENEIDLASMDHDHFDKSIYENDPTQTESFVDPHSLFYDRHSKKVIDDIGSLPRKQNKEISLLRTSSEDCDTLKVYYKRLILMLLSNANLQMEDDSVKGQLFIKGTYKEIETLRKLDTENYSVKEIDLILSNIISEASYYNYFIHVPNLTEIIFSLSKIWDYHVEIIVIATMIAAIIILSKLMPPYHTVCAIIVALFTISFYMTWCDLLKEAEIKLAVEQVKYTEMPLACQPHKMNFWDTLKSYIFDNKECEKYLSARMSNPKLGVTPALVLTHMFATVALQPVALIGETISKFINNATAHLNWLSGPVQVILYVGLLPCFIIIVLALKGFFFKFGGPLFTFSFGTNKQASIANNDKRQTIELIREVLAEAPRNITLSINENVKTVPMLVASITQEDNRSTDNLSEDHSTKLVSKKSEKEQICASGDSVQNDLLSEESEKTNKECVETTKTDTAKHIGSGDA